MTIEKTQDDSQSKENIKLILTKELIEKIKIENKINRIGK